MEREAPVPSDAAVDPGLPQPAGKGSQPRGSGAVGLRAVLRKSASASRTLSISVRKITATTKTYFRAARANEPTCPSGTSEVMKAHEPVPSRDRQGSVSSDAAADSGPAKPVHSTERSFPATLSIGLSKARASSLQKMYFNANCICLGTFDVLVTLPPAATSIVAFGLLKYAELVRLNASPRN